MIYSTGTKDKIRHIHPTFIYSTFDCLSFTKDGGVSGQVVKVVHDDGDEEVQHDEGAEEDEGDEVDVRPI